MGDLLTRVIIRDDRAKLVGIVGENQVLIWYECALKVEKSTKRSDGDCDAFQRRMAAPSGPRILSKFWNAVPTGVCIPANPAAPKLFLELPTDKDPTIRNLNSICYKTLSLEQISRSENCKSDMGVQ